MTPLHDLVEPVIIHYSGPDKPWRRFGRDKALVPDGQAFALYRGFIKRTPWSGWLRTQWTLPDLIQSISHEFKRVRRRLAGRPIGLSPAGIERYVAAFRDHCERARFVDVEQGLSTREDGRLRLKRPVGP